MTTLHIPYHVYAILTEIVANHPNNKETSGNIVIENNQFNYRFIYDYDGYNLLHARFLLFNEGLTYYIATDFSVDKLKEMLKKD